MRVPSRWSRRPPRNPGIWLAGAVVEFLLGLFFAFGVTGAVAVRGVLVALAAVGVAVGLLRADHDRRRQLSRTGGRTAADHGAGPHPRG